MFEADESDGSFLLARPAVGVVTNVDVDHVDFYPGGAEEIEAAFGRFVRGCDQVVACGDDSGVRSVLADTTVAALRYGTARGPRSGGHGGRARPRGVPADASAIGQGDEGSLRLQVDGAAQPAERGRGGRGRRRSSGVPLAEVAADAVGAYTGVHRRFEHRGSARGADFFDDYGHTPAEMA